MTTKAIPLALATCAIRRAHLPETERRPVNEALGKIRWRAQTRPRIARNTAAWLKAKAR